ncbi:MAG: radical SAM family heme chaperone HemW [Pseudomonadota bacterium]
MTQTLERPAVATYGGFAVYVHWPFCASKCPYCDFNSHVRPAGVDQPRYAAAIAREIKTLAADTAPAAPLSVFFGGGTPSLMAPQTVETILTAIADTVGLPDDAEITMEANPGSVDEANFAGYRAAGVNRVSLGVQSLIDADLQRLGRLHDAATARRALALAQRIFPRVSADLIYARPGQTTAAWRDELTNMLAICGGHLSLYQLTIEPETRFYDLAAAGKLRIPDDDHAADLYDLTAELTAAAGVPAYEVSNHARPGEEARHNLVYWRGGAYLGVGPGAHGRLAAQDGRIATETIRRPEDWLAAVEAHGHGLTARTPLSADDRAAETLVMGLRLAEGIDPEVYAHRAGAPLDPAAIARLINDGLLSDDGGRLTVPPHARLLTNAAVRGLLP